MAPPEWNFTQSDNFFSPVLPTELVLKICECLCLHCQLDCVVAAPSEELMAGLENQKALSCLSRCNRRLCSIAQPVLFHWFEDSTRSRDYTRPIGARRLKRFTLTIVRQPGLAGSVRALFLRAPVTEALDDPNFNPHQKLARAISPGITQLFLHDLGIFGSDDELEPVGWPYGLPNLKFLVCPGTRLHKEVLLQHHIYQIQTMLRRAPKLEVLIAPNCGCNSVAENEWYYSIQPWGVPFPRLKKLSVDGIGVRTLKNIISSCPVLEDLEYFHDHDDEVLDPDHHLGHVGATLRRLCYSGTPYKRWVPEFNYNVVFNESLVQWRTGVANVIEKTLPTKRGLSFARFSALEELEIEQLLILPPVFLGSEDPGGQDFLSRLPPAVKHLRFGCIVFWPTILRGLMALADNVNDPSKFPRLETVTLELYIRCLREFGVQHLIDTFYASRRRVQLRVFLVEEEVQNRAKGVHPPRPGQRRYPKQLLYDSRLTRLDICA
ncbi:hypothetical protein QBC46DRAFT_320156 [Diplogelasinospora grovesii]|uniref:F-box domain-containing protein n=1 Tax=Diplogelasinospora grovesii TaxID=303347 RepID=A0AAN6S1K5_9PEZI|nr:hypothetical protein QBC46DRAFT_320156 [Diplogelasinospora grovesii]